MLLFLQIKSIRWNSERISAIFSPQINSLKRAIPAEFAWVAWFIARIEWQAIYEK